MTLNKFLLLLAVLSMPHLLGCGPKSSTPAAGPKTLVAGLPNGLSLTALTGVNVIPMTVNGSSCRAGSYVNKPCVSLTVCTPGTSTCQVINDILVDTGSYGLRIFNSVLTTAVPTQITAGGQSLAACARFGDGSSLWGPVKLADVVMGGEAAVQIPIQAVDSTFGTVPAGCGTPSTNPTNAGFNGILGIGFFKQDCGTSCTTLANVGMYYKCTGSSCSGTTVPLANQITNPVAAQATDNNGVILELPNIYLNGVASIETAYMVLGIGTRSNNVPSGVTAYTANPNTGEFTTTYAGHTYDSFIDSGSNALYFPSSLPDCGSTLAGWYCPGSVTTLSATNTSYTGSLASVINFPVGNLYSMLTTNGSADVFAEIAGGGLAGSLFDWGLPFYIGRNVYLGIENTSSTLGTGPYWAY